LRLTCTILWEHLQTYCNPTFNFDEPAHLAPNMYCIFGEHLQTDTLQSNATDIAKILTKCLRVAALPFIQAIRTRRPALSGSPWIHRGTLLHPPHLSLHFEMSGKASCLKAIGTPVPSQAKLPQFDPSVALLFRTFLKDFWKRDFFSGQWSFSLSQT